MAIVRIACIFVYCIVGSHYGALVEFGHEQELEPVGSVPKESPPSTPQMQGSGFLSYMQEMSFALVVAQHDEVEVGGKKTKVIPPPPELRCVYVSDLELEVNSCSQYMCVSTCIWWARNRAEEGPCNVRCSVDEWSLLMNYEQMIGGSGQSGRGHHQQASGRLGQCTSLPRLRRMQVGHN